MNTRLSIIITLVVVSISLAGAVVSQAQEEIDSSTIGPYTEIQLPLEDLPALNENLAYHPEIAQYESGATLQVMYVLEDPRDVPLARYAYYSDDLGVIAPNDLPVSVSDLPEYREEMEEILSTNPKTVNVYIRVTAPADQRVSDPLFEDLKRPEDESGGYIRPYNPNRPAMLVYFPGYSGRPFSCAAPEYINGPEPYQLPPGINGGNAVGSDGLYDPKAFAPPRPWYDNQDAMLAPGEVREGWVSCMVPAMSVENILIRALYSYTPEPQPTPTPGPSPTPYDDSGCVVVESLDDPACIEAECCTIVLIDPTMQAIEETAQALEETAVADESYYVPQEEIGSVLAWSYTRAASIPDGGIRLEDTSVVFINEEGDQKTAAGTVLIKTANIIQIERYEFNDFLFVAEVGVEPDGLSEEDLQGYVLYRIYADVEVYEQANTSTVILEIEGVQNKETSTYERFMRTNFYYPFWGGVLHVDEGKQAFDNMFRHDPDSPLTGYIFGDLTAERYGPLSQRDSAWNEQIPTRLWFNINSSTPAVDEIGESKIRDLTRYAAKGVNIHSTSFEARTTMCEVVECLDVRDPKDHNNEVRTVPLMCPGEWANDFVIDSLRIENIDYIGSPEGLISFLAPDLFSYVRFINEQPRAWIYSGRILGGISSWWSTKQHNNNGRLIDLSSGSYITGITYDATIGILPYYYKGASAYYVPTSDSYQKSGWISGIASEKLLIFGINDNEKIIRDQVAFLFMEEGPLWTNSCSRSTNQAISSIDLYSPPLTGSSFEIYSDFHEMVDMMPGMRYPVSEPRFIDGLLQLGEPGPQTNDQILRPIGVKIIPGRANEPIFYIPDEDAYYPARKHESDNNKIYLQRAGAEFIPPDSSLVLVRLEKVSPGGNLDCRTKPENIQLSYPGYYPISASPRSLLEFNIGLLSYICSDDEFSDKWLAFKFPSLNVDQNQLLFSIKGEDNWVFWSLDQN